MQSRAQPDRRRRRTEARRTQIDVANRRTLSHEPGGRRTRVDTTHDYVILVDRTDREIGIMQKIDAHRLGRCHRAISVLIRDAAGRLLLQQRAAGKYHSGGLWSNTCCSHPLPGEETLYAATRRLGEEMGIAASLSPLFSMKYRARVSDQFIESEIVHVFGGTSDEPPNPNASEVEGWRWMTLAEIKRSILERPQAYTVWFRRFIEEYEEEIESFASA
ncbi:MAG: isopentenyl-diphosphate Delta-isomerase [Bradyrhizobiaceae bacterium]|nr:isopentenyl-diphosphate Delta-isomerase [Bradyrhizobiaceae bacterium]